MTLPPYTTYVPVSTNIVLGVTTPVSSAAADVTTLKRGAGRVPALGGAGQQRGVGIAPEGLPVVLQVTRVEGGRGGAGQEGARRDVERDDGALVAGQRLLRRVLHVGHERRDDVGAHGATAQDLSIQFWTPRSGAVPSSTSFISRSSPLRP